jgi:hypothetical protein
MTRKSVFIVKDWPWLPKTRGSQEPTIRNSRWLPPQVIVLTQDHMGKIEKYVLL